MLYKKFNNYSNTFVFDTGKKGPIISIFGGIHGNETAGVDGIKKLVKNINNGVIKLLNGKLILAYGNEKAIDVGKREYKYNMNRLFKNEYLNTYSKEYEIIRAKQLAEIIRNSDILLDIHSVSSDSIPFIFSEKIDFEIDIAKKIYNGNIIVGWSGIGGDLLGGDTDSYIHSLGKTGFTLECGNHNNLNAFNIGYESILNLMKYMGMLDAGEYKYSLSKNKIIEMYKIQVTKTGKFVFKKDIRNFDFIEKGAFIGTDGVDEVRATEDFIILLPNYEEAKIGEEVFYYGKQIN